MKLSIPVSRVSPEELIAELADGNPAPEEKWFQRDYFDPTYGAGELRSAALKGWIELEVNDDPHLWRFRLTPAGRAALAEGLPTNA